MSTRTNRPSGCVDPEILAEGIEVVRKNFRDLLETGAQADGFPPELKAAGQYLDAFDFDQRGLFGTAAAIRTLATNPLTTSDRELVEQLVRYVDARRSFELSSASESKMEVMRTRLDIEERDAFKTADLIFSLAQCPDAVSGRESIMQTLILRVQRSRLPRGGWSVDLDPNNSADLLATAHLIRALAATGAEVTAGDVELIVGACEAHQWPTSTYNMTFLVLSLLTLDKEKHRELGKQVFRRLNSVLAPEFATLVEANHEYRFESRTFYVRVPWQIYMMESCALLFPLGRFLTWTWQRRILEWLRLLNSSSGFVYRALGDRRSTRTHACLVDALKTIRAVYQAAPYHWIPIQTINGITRFCRIQILDALTDDRRHSVRVHFCILLGS